MDTFNVISFHDDFIKKASQMEHINDSELMPTYPRGINRLLPSKASREAFKKFFLQYLSIYQPDIVFFHQLFDSRWNSAFQYVKFNNPKTKVFLLPDGMLNTVKNPLSKKHIRKQAIRKWYGSIIGYPYYSYIGDWTGIDDTEIEKIWMPENFPNDYNDDKCYYFKTKKKSLKNKITDKQKKALFLDQPVVGRKIIDKHQYDEIIKKIENYFNKKNIVVYYKPHPKMKIVSIPKSFTLLSLQPEELLENHILEENYSYVSSFFTTSLLMNVLASNEKNFISFDNNNFFKKKFSSIYIKLQEAGVNYVNL